MSWALLPRVEETATHRLKVVLHHVGAQESMADLVHIPRPSHLDDWHLYKQLKAEEPEKEPSPEPELCEESEKGESSTEDPSSPGENIQSEDTSEDSSSSTGLGELHRPWWKEKQKAVYVEGYGVIAEEEEWV